MSQSYLRKVRKKKTVICWSNHLKCRENTLNYSAFYFKCNYCRRGSGQQTWKSKGRRNWRKRRRKKERQLQSCWKKSRSVRLEAADLELRQQAGKLSTSLRLPLLISFSALWLKPKCRATRTLKRCLSKLCLKVSRSYFNQRAVCEGERVCVS